MRTKAGRMANQVSLFIKVINSLMTLVNQINKEDLK